MKTIVRRARTVVALAVVVASAILFAAVMAWCGLVVGSDVTAGLLLGAPRWLVVALFVVALFFGTSFFLILGLLPALFSTGRLRVLAVPGAITGYRGFFAGAIWILWLGGDPTRITFRR